MVILDRKLYNNAIEEIISDSSKFEKLNEDPTLKREASLQQFLRKLKQKNFFNEIEYDIWILIFDIWKLNIFVQTILWYIMNIVLVYL